MSQNKNNADWERLLQAQKETERQLREQKLQLDAALNNMLQGLCMFDAEEKIVLFNQRYLDMMKLPAGDVHVGPSDHVPWLTDRKFCHIRLEGSAFGNVPLACELKLEVWDSPNSAGVVIDAVRCAKLALDRGLSGALYGPSSWFMKSPPRQFTDAEARRRTEVFIRGEP